MLRTGCFKYFKYFKLGGDCVCGPVSLLSGWVLFLVGTLCESNHVSRIEQSMLLLARHFFAVTLYTIWVMFAHPH